MKKNKVLRWLFIALAFTASALGTVPSSTTWIQYVLSTTPQTLTVPFVFQSGSDVLVLDSKASPPIVLTQNSDYSVSGGNGSTGSVTALAGGANAVKAGDIITISRRVPLTQTTTFSNGGPLTASMIGQAFDKAVQISQQINLLAANSLQLPGDEMVSGVLGKSQRSGNVVGFDQTGNLQFYPPANVTITGNAAQFASIAALRLGSISGVANGTGVQVAGYWSAGDQGGGVYIWNSTDTDADNGGTIIAPTGVATGRWILQTQGYYNTKNFGAKGDFSTDDTTFLQAAINAANAAGGGTVLIVGRLKTTATIVLKPRVNILGTNSARLAASSPASLPTSEIHNTGTALDCLYLSDATAVKNRISNVSITGAAGTGNGVTIAHAYDCAIEDCIISNHGGDGIHISDAPSFVCVNNQIVGNGGIGISTGVNTNGFVIQGCHVQSNGSYGVSLNSPWGCAVIGSVFEGNTTRELYATIVGGLVIHGCYFEGSATVKCYFDNNVRGLSIDGCFFNGPVNTGVGVSLADATFEMNSISITNNWFRQLLTGVNVSNGGTGAGMSDCVIGPNYFEDPANPTVTRYNFNATPLRAVQIIDDAGSAWMPSTAYAVGITAVNNSRIYVVTGAGTSAGSGGPTGTGSGITDGTVTWNYQNPYAIATELRGNSNQRGIRRLGLPTGTGFFDFVAERGLILTQANNADTDTGISPQGFVFCAGNSNAYANVAYRAGGTVTSISQSGFAFTKDNASTINLYHDSGTGTLHVQNKTGGSVNYMIYGMCAFQ